MLKDSTRSVAMFGDDINEKGYQPVSSAGVGYAVEYHAVQSLHKRMLRSRSHAFGTDEIIDNCGLFAIILFYL